LNPPKDAPLPEITLAIEVSNPGADATAAADTPRSGVALGRRSTHGSAIECLGVEWLHPTSRHDDALMPAIDTLCRTRSVQPGDLSRVAVSLGPGGYTSLRIGVTIAKMIAQATGAACIGVPTADAILANLADQLSGATTARVCLAWKRDSAWRQDFTRDSGGWRGVAPGGIVLLDELAHRVPDALICEAPLRAMLPSSTHHAIIEPVFDPRGVLATSANLAPIDPLLLAPIYPREPEAVTKWRELHPR